eukprot:205618_1
MDEKANRGERPNNMAVGEQSSANSGAPNGEADLAVFVQDLLGKMQERFKTMSDSIIGRIDEMGTRIDDLEKSIGDLMTQSGISDVPVVDSRQSQGGLPQSQSGLPQSHSGGLPPPSNAHVLDEKKPEKL